MRVMQRLVFQINRDKFESTHYELYILYEPSGAPTED